MDEKRVVTVFRPGMEWQGDLIVQELKEAGLDAYLANRSTVGLWPEIVADLEIIVPEGQAERAEEIIKEFLARMGKPPEAEEVLPEEEPLE